MNTEHFGTQDKMIPCPCCGRGELSPGMHVLLELVRVHFQAPVTINSGCRCRKHHMAIYVELGKEAPDDSDHLLDERLWSHGADIVVKGHTPFEVYNFLNNCPFASVLALGIYDWGIHVGLREGGKRW